MPKKYAGTWAADSSQPAGARLTVDRQALTPAAESKKLRTAAPITAVSYFGKLDPPEGFDVALLGEVEPRGLTLLAMKDAAGPHLKVDANPMLEKQFGKAALVGKFRRCP